MHVLVQPLLAVAAVCGLEKIQEVEIPHGASAGTRLVLCGGSALDFEGDAMVNAANEVSVSPR